MPKMEQLLFEEDYSCSPLVLIDSAQSGLGEVLNLESKDAVRIEEALKTFWSVQYELRIRFDIRKKEIELEEAKIRLNKHLKGGE